MEYLECFYGCNFLTSVSKEHLTKGAHNYAISAQREIFPILDKLSYIFEITGSNICLSKGSKK